MPGLDRFACFALLTVCLAGATGACKGEDTVVVPEPEPVVAPEPEPLWFDAQSGGDWSASMRTLSDAHFSDFDGLRAPPMPASRIEMSWEQREKITVQGNQAASERRVERCLDFELPKATLELYEPFFGQAMARQDTLRRSPKTVVWERPGLGQSGEFVFGEISLDLQSLGPGLSVSLCAGRELESGVVEMMATLEADWRLKPAAEFAREVMVQPHELAFVVEGERFETEAVYDLHDARQLNAARTWLRARGLETDAVERTWKLQVGEVLLIAEVSGWDQVPVELELRTESALPVL